MHLKSRGCGLRGAGYGSDERRARSKPVALVAALATIASVAAVASSCGARSSLPIPLPDPPPPECMTYEDCRGARNFCEPVGCELEEKIRKEDGLRYLVGTCVDLEPVVCDDGDECTIDSCDPEDGTCSTRPAIIDADGDGYFGPRAGFAAGEPHSCGDDCDDTSAAAHPGAIEICDGVDNDCNTIIDDGATWIPLDGEPIRLSDDGSQPSYPGGIAWSAETWLATFSVNDGGGKAFKSRLAPDGTEIDPHDVTVEEANADGAAGPVIWVGDRYGTVWSNRGSGDYQIVFSLLDEEGTRVSPNLQVASSGGFSLEPGIAWTGQRFVVVWKQETADGNALYRIDAQLFDIDGAPLLPAAVTIASAAVNSAQAPAVAASSRGVGLAYTLGDQRDKRVAVRLFDADLVARSDELLLAADDTTDKRFTTIASNRSDYIVAWSDGDQGANGIWGAVVGDDGLTVAAPRRLIDPGVGQYAKWPSIRALGDRALLVYSQGESEADFEIWARMFDAQLEPIEEARRITFAPEMTAYPLTAFGPDGTLGVLFSDKRLGPLHTWFTRLGCAVAQP